MSIIQSSSWESAGKGEERLSTNEERVGPGSDGRRSRRSRTVEGRPHDRLLKRKMNGWSNFLTSILFFEHSLKRSGTPWLWTLATGRICLSTRIWEEGRKSCAMDSMSICTLVKTLDSLFPRPGNSQVAIPTISLRWTSRTGKISTCSWIRVSTLDTCVWLWMVWFEAGLVDQTVEQEVSCVIILWMGLMLSKTNSELEWFRTRQSRSLREGETNCAGRRPPSVPNAVPVRCLKLCYVRTAKGLEGRCRLRSWTAGKSQGLCQTVSRSGILSSGRCWRRSSL